MTESTDAQCGSPRKTYLHTAESWRGRTIVVTVSGEIDMLTAPLLQDAINTAAAGEPSAVLVDLSEVDFLASAGMDVFLIAHREITKSARFCIVAENRAIRRPIELVGLHHVVPLYATIDDAMRDVTES